MTSIRLVCLGEPVQSLKWELGPLSICKPTPQALAALLEHELRTCPAQAWLIWDSEFGQPDTDLLLKLLEQNVDVWHAGLKLGMGGKPEMLNFISPTWMLNRDPDSNIEATSWRLSLRACLVRTEVLRQLGGPLPVFESLTGAALEMGYRYIRHGVFIRHCPSLLANRNFGPDLNLLIRDELFFLQCSFPPNWIRWAKMRACLTGMVKPGRMLSEWRAQKASPLPPKLPAFTRQLERLPAPPDAKVTVLIPTINRYPYLRTLLAQLGQQTVQPLEIIIVDQTPLAERDIELRSDFPDLPIRLFTLDKAGQCSSRNLGLQKASGDYALFVDDDVEVGADLIEKHLQNLRTFRVNVSCGVVVEPPDLEIPADFRLMRVSDVFPTCNAMVRTQALHASGLFDLAYDHGQRADHDLGMRLYLSGEMMLLDPDIVLLHHHAPTGGLREHKARVSTYAASRQLLFKHNLLTVSDIYHAKRYFSSAQLRERIWISLLGTFSINGPWWKKALKLFLSGLLLPFHWHKMDQAARRADAMLRAYPQIPILDAKEA